MKAFVAIVLATAVLFALVPPSVRPEESGDHARLLESSIDSLRSAAKNAEALAAARQLLALKRSTPDIKACEIVDAEWLLRTLEFIVSLPEDAQTELARAYTMNARYAKLVDAGEYEQAIALAEDQCRIERRFLGSRFPDVSAALNNAGYFLFITGHRARADSCYREALAIDLALYENKHPNVAIDLNNIAGVLQEEGNSAGADTLYRESLAIFCDQLGANSLEAASVLTSLGTLYKDRGDYLGAEPLFRKALALRRESPEAAREDVAASVENLAALLAAKGDPADAEPLFREALEAYRALRGDSHPDVARTLVHLASLLHDAKDYSNAETLYRQALGIYERFPEEVRERVAAINDLAELFHDEGKYEMADPLYAQALDMSRAHAAARSIEVATFLTNRARNLRDSGKLADAESMYLEAIGIFRALLGEKNPYIAMSFYSYANCLAARKRYDEAERILAQAIEAYEASRSRVGTALERSAFLTSPYPNLANVYLQEGAAERAWPAVERDLGRGLADLLLAANWRLLSASERAREDSLTKVIDYLESQLVAYASADTARVPPGERERTKTCLDVAEQAWSELQLGLAEKHPISEGNAYPIARIQKALPRNAAIVGWLDVEERKGEFVSWGYVIRNLGLVTWVRVGSAPSEENVSPFNRALSLRNALASGLSGEEELKRKAAEFWRDRLAPLLPALRGVDNLVVIPSGPMLGIPLEALVNADGMYLNDRYTISYAPSATIYAWLREKSRERRGIASHTMLLVGDPPFTESQLSEMTPNWLDSIQGTAGRAHADSARGKASTAPPDSLAPRRDLAGNRAAPASLPRLIGTRAEVLRIASLVSSPTILLGPDASEEKLFRLSTAGRLADYSIIHIATHAIIDDAKPERSALVLSQVRLPDPLASLVERKRLFDGLLTAKEIVGEWKLNADLVTLSACETGLGKRIGGEGYIGFSQAFFQAGARSLVVSLWKVNDEATSLLMQRFYENYFGLGGRHAAHMTKAEALRKAKEYLKTYVTKTGERPFAHPYYWSAFILIGDSGS